MIKIYFIMLQIIYSSLKKQIIWMLADIWLFHNFKQTVHVLLPSTLFECLTPRNCFQISMDFQGNDGKGDGGSAKKQLQDWATDLINNLPDGKFCYV